jgi:hypothetical protein
MLEHAGTTRDQELLSGRRSDRDFISQLSSPTPRTLFAAAKATNSTRDRLTSRRKHSRPSYHLVLCSMGGGPGWTPEEGAWGLHTSLGGSRQVLQVERSKPNLQCPFRGDH